MSQAFQESLAKAKIKIMADKDSCFLANVALRMRYEIDNSQSTAAVDGITVFLNEEFFLNRLNPETRATTLLHEIGHVVRQHNDRQGNRHPGLYNEAGDYVINQELKDSGWEPIKWISLITEMPTEWLQDDRFKGMSTEEVYDILLAEQQNGMPPPPGMFPDLKKPPKDMSKEAMTNAVQDILVSSAQAAIMAGQAGSIPGEVQVFLDGLLKPKLPLASQLRRFFKVLNAKSYTWSRPNRRHQARGIYLPAARGQELCHIAFAFDMSGSVSDKDIKRYVSELVGVMTQLKPTKLTLVQFDTRIISVDVMKSVNDIMKLKLQGRGGTQIMPLMDWAHKEKPEALVVFTDGEFTINESMNPKVPVLWLIHGGRKFPGPFGQTTTFEV